MPRDVVVVGGGVIGASIALELVRGGRHVTLLERDAVIGGGASTGNAGYICPSHSAPLASPAALAQGIRWLFSKDSPLRIKPRPAVLPWLTRFMLASTPARAASGAAALCALANASLELHAGLPSVGIRTGFTRSGILDLYETAAGLELAIADARRSSSTGVAGEVLDRTQTVKLEPTLIGPFVGAIYNRDEAFCDPRAYATAVARAAAAEGAEVITDAEALTFQYSGRRISGVETTRGAFTGREFVLAAGLSSRRLARSAGLRLRLEGGKGYHVDFEPASNQPKLAVYLQEARVTTTPLPGSLRFTGVLDLSGDDLSVDTRRVNGIVRAAERVFGPSLTSKRIAVWRGLRPCLPDGLPAIGRSPSVDNLVVCTGHSMLGLTLAPISGVLTAEVVARTSPSFDLRPFRVAAR